MPINFKKPIFGDSILNLNKTSFSEEKVRKSTNGKLTVEFLQEAIDNKFIKFDTVNAVFKHFARNEFKKGVCSGEAHEVLFAAMNHGVKKRLPQKVSKIDVLVTQMMDCIYTNLRTALRLTKEGNLKKLQEISANSSNYVETHNVNVQTLEKFINETDEKMAKMVKADLETRSEAFPLKKKQQPSEYLKKLFKNTKQVYLLICLYGKGTGHAIAAGVNKKPFFYDSNRGYTRPKNIKELVKLITKDYLAKDGKHFYIYKRVVIQSLSA